MKKFNALIFVCFYLLLSKMVFAATVEVEGKQYNCEAPKSYMTYVCANGSKKIIVGMTDGGWAAFSKEGPGIVSLKSITKLIDGKVLYQSNEIAPYEDTIYNRKIAADQINFSLGSKSEPLAKELVSEANTFNSNYNEVIPSLTLKMNEGGDVYQCTKGSTRPLTNKQTSLQDQYKTKFTCPYYSCSGKDPAEKVLMVLPKPGNTFTSPNMLVMKNGQAKLVEGGYKISNGSSLLIANFPKGYNSDNDDNTAGLPPADVNPDLLIPSKYNDSKSSYKYLLDMAKKDFDDSGYLDLCSGNDIKALGAERKKIGLAMQSYLSEAELIEYLKVIDGSIHSYYVDRKKGQTLGCLYQNKVVDSSVLGQYGHLKEISTVKSNGKYLRPDEVQDLFKKAKNMKDIPFDYKYDGCYARAHVMSKRFEAMGIPTQKAWIKGKLFVPGTDIEWQYHVAPTVEVKEKNGKIVNYVIDPSLTDKAVPLDEWVAAMGKKTTGPIMKTTYPFPGNALDFQRTTVAISPSDVYAPTDLQSMSAEDKMEFSTQKLKEFTEVLASQGKR
ncbi:MAG: hypothetical protein H7177_15590 [Rhizobacter sp.]|nr:hypothetical protein [Bacteriovorax sp.]